VLVFVDSLSTAPRNDWRNRAGFYRPGQQPFCCPVAGFDLSGTRGKLGFRPGAGPMPGGSNRVGHRVIRPSGLKPWLGDGGWCKSYGNRRRRTRQRRQLRTNLNAGGVNRNLGKVHDSKGVTAAWGTITVADGGPLPPSRLSACRDSLKDHDSQPYGLFSFEMVQYFNHRRARRRGPSNRRMSGGPTIPAASPPGAFNQGHHAGATARGGEGRFRRGEGGGFSIRKLPRNTKDDAKRGRLPWGMPGLRRCPATGESKYPVTASTPRTIRTSAANMTGPWQPGRATADRWARGRPPARPICFPLNPRTVRRGEP